MFDYPSFSILSLWFIFLSGYVQQPVERHLCILLSVESAVQLREVNCYLHRWRGSFHVPSVLFLPVQFKDFSGHLQVVSWKGPKETLYTIRILRVGFHLFLGFYSTFLSIGNPTSFSLPSFFHKSKKLVRTKREWQTVHIRAERRFESQCLSSYYNHYTL